MNDVHCGGLVEESLFGALDPAVYSGESVKSLFPEFKVASPIMLDTLMQVAKIAKSSSSVLVLGESGTGKELIASAIHRLSQRSHQKFIAINCSAIPEDLLEAELFGHEKGAFTGADRKRVGYFGLANRGSIFLDEIGDMPPRLQAKLLRILQERKYTPLGSGEERDVDVRIIAATNVNLGKAVELGKFRLDLYYRLNVLPIHVPPLRDRKEDIECLLYYFLNQANYVHQTMSPCYFKKELMDLLREYFWPGNVRELQNLVERLVIMSHGGALGLGSLPPDILGQKVAPSVSQPLAAKRITELEVAHEPEIHENGIELAKLIDQIEFSYIDKALQMTANNKNQAAKLLGLNRTTLVEKIKRRKFD